VTRSLIAVLVCGALMAGCANGTLEPAYHRPTPAVPATFPAGPAYAPPPAADTPTPGWRDVFVDARLRGVIGQALANSRDLQVAVGQIEAASAQYHVQRAALLPTVNATADADYAREYTGLPPAFGPPYERVTEYSAGLGVTNYELDLFGRIRSLTKAAREQYLATEEARNSTEITLVAQVASDWLTLASDESLLKVSQATVDSGAQNLNLAQRRLTGGIGSQLDVSNALTVVEQARADVGRYITQVAQDKNALDLVVGAPVAAEALPAGIDDPGARLPPVPGELTSALLLRRPDVVEAEHQLRAANADVGAARAAFFPSISLTGSGGSTTGSLSRLFAAGTGVWAFAPTITLPIFDGGANSGNLAYAKAQYRIGIAQYQKAIQTAFREVADALADHGTIAERLRAQQSLVAAAADSLRLSQALYARGSDSYIDVLTAQRALYAAQQSQVAIQLTAANNVVTLYKVFGGGLANDTPAAR
jgi:multidrug efflux system outer membrane protein